ncbi:MAG: YwaF family protein, partial [Clostridia bacterium]|nr:YwaF family protein [Clostridia bacterium]
GYSIGINDLPFHICTIMATMVPFVQFSQKFSGIKKIIVALSITSSLMWMCYPGSALGGQPPFSYVIFSKFIFHGALFCWGVLNLSLGAVKLQFKKIWQELCAILVILVWADIGNTLYGSEQNWFFIEYSIFPFLSDKVMPLMVVFCVFGSCLVVYGAYYFIRAIALRPKHTKAPKRA